MNNLIFNRLMPKETKFFPLLNEIADVVLTSSDLMIDCLSVPTYEEAVEYYKKIKEQEHTADVLIQKIFNELNTTFITPFDREDIHDLADSLENITDGLNSSAKKVALYHPLHTPDEAIELAHLIKKAAVCIKIAVEELEKLKKNLPSINQQCENLHQIENQADDVYENFITRLFKEEKDSIELIKLKEITGELEDTTDLAEHVGKVIRTIVVKYA